MLDKSEAYLRGYSDGFQKHFYYDDSVTVKNPYDYSTEEHKEYALGMSNAIFELMKIL